MTVAVIGEAPGQPVLTVLHGAPSPEELAVVVALLAAGGDGSEAPVTAQSRWSAPSARLGSAGPARDAWRFSGMPR
ncbi:MAG: acyl-CoA carboxylase epsilon subunit [Candidatus Phosphoribacter sp.]